MEYKEQVVENLEYNLLAETNEDFRFNILKNQKINFLNGQVELNIIGASHIIEINLEEIEFSELFACLDFDKEKCNILDQVLVSNNDSVSLEKQLTDNINFKTYLKVLDFSTTYAFEEFNSQLRKEEENYFYFPFPKGAITSIRYKKEKNKLSWVTYHSYPNQNKIMRTKSVLEVLD